VEDVASVAVASIV